MALKHSPRIRLAQDDLDRSKAVGRETKDAYVPSVGATGGAGASYGITLSVPTIFTINAQSLVFSYQQRYYIRASKLDAKAAELALKDAREAVEEDAAVTYVTLEHSQEMLLALMQESGLAEKLQHIMEERKAAGLESDPAMDQATKTSLQTSLQTLQTRDQIDALQEHMATLTGLPKEQIVTLGASVPPVPEVTTNAGDTASSSTDSPSLLAAMATAEARKERAFGDSRFLWRPQVSLAAQYGRVSPINSVSEYYNLHGNYNTASAGLVIQFPFLDAARKQRARESEIDARHAAHQADLLRSEQMEDRQSLHRTLAELTTKQRLAELDQKLAQTQLNATLIQTKSGGYDGPPLTPKDEMNARLQERQRFVDSLDAQLQLQKSEIFLLRKLGELDTWVMTKPSSAAPGTF